MKRYIPLIIISLILSSCDNKSKVERAVDEIPVQMKVFRFEQAFFDAKPEDLPIVKADFPDFSQKKHPMRFG